MKTNQLSSLRKDIDEIDDQIIRLLEKRFSLIEKLAVIKPTLTDENRESEILSKISSKVIREVYRLLFSLSKKEILKKKRS